MLSDEKFKQDLERRYQDFTAQLRSGKRFTELNELSPTQEEITRYARILKEESEKKKP